MEENLIKLAREKNDKELEQFKVNSIASLLLRIRDFRNKIKDQEEKIESIEKLDMIPTIECAQSRDGYGF